MRIMALVLCSLLALAEIAGAQTAFVGAVGPGRNANCWRDPHPTAGTNIVYIDNLNNSGPGSFRAAMTASGKRIAIVRVGGDIIFTSTIVSGADPIYFTGATAQGRGIRVRMTLGIGNGLGFGTPCSALRFLRMRGAAGAQEPHGDLIQATGDNLIVDHSSFGWADDEIVGSMSADSSTWSYNINTPVGLSSGTWFIHSNVQDVAIWRNLFIHCQSRCPLTSGTLRFQVVNNVHHNHWSGSQGFARFSAISMHWLANYHIEGPKKNQNYETIIQCWDDRAPQPVCPNCPREEPFNGVSQFHWPTSGININRNLPATGPEENATLFQDTGGGQCTVPLVGSPITVTSGDEVPVISAGAAYLDVVGTSPANANVGPNKPDYDEYEEDILTDVYNRTGLSEVDVSPAPPTFTVATTDILTNCGMTQAFIDHFGVTCTLANARSTAIGDSLGGDYAGRMLLEIFIGVESGDHELPGGGDVTPPAAPSGLMVSMR